MEAIKLKAITMRNPAGRLWFDPPAVIQTCNRWWFQLVNENFHLPEHPYLIITIVLDDGLAENRVKLQPSSQFEPKPNYIERHWTEVFYYAQEIPKEAAALEEFCNRMMEESISVFADCQDNAAVIARVKKIIELNGTQTMANVGVCKKYKTGLRGVSMRFCGPSPYGGEAYIYTTDVERKRLVQHKLCDFNEYPDLFELLDKLVVKDECIDG
jgi:hypothetical protein